MIDFTEYEKVDLGCGQNKHEGALGVDIVATDATDLVIDLEDFPWEVPDNTFSTIYCIDILEHVDEPLRFLEEVYRIATDGAMIHVKTPHFTNNNTWVDPTHKRGFSIFTFQDYVTEEGKYSYYTEAIFDPVSIEIGFVPGRKLPWNVLGRYIANQWPWLYEKTVLRGLFPAQSITVELRARKP